MMITPGSKPFTWSYSKLKNFESCPKRNWHVDIAKDAQEEASQQLADGNELHDAMAARINNGKQLPLHLDHMEPIAARLLAIPDARIRAENKTAIDRDFNFTTYFAPRVWMRGIIDVLVVKGRVAMVTDWKTGKTTEDNPQLALFAQAVFSQRPEVEAVRTEFFWTQTMEATRKDWKRADMPAFWAMMLPRVAAMEKAHKTSEYPAKPGRLCRKWCPVQQCTYHGTSQG